MAHQEARKIILANPAAQAEYERLAPEYELLDELLRARQEAGLTQAELAAKMGAKPPAISRLLKGLSTNTHSPSLATLRKYAQACGMKLHIKLVK
ncbi:MAG TPA: transcriptional regulator [Desulfobulbaceae bacterium]|nr:transcriptional regulator [Desulfobulbaceae bacterium]